MEEMREYYEDDETPEGALELTSTSERLKSIGNRLLELVEGHFVPDFAEKLKALQSEYEDIVRSLGSESFDEMKARFPELARIRERILEAERKLDAYLFYPEFSIYDKIQRLLARQRMAHITGNQLTERERIFLAQYGTSFVDGETGRDLSPTDDLEKRRHRQLLRLVREGHTRGSINEMVVRQVGERARREKWEDLYGLGHDPETMMQAVRARIEREARGEAAPSDRSFEDEPYTGIGSVSLTELFLEPDYVAEAYRPAVFAMWDVLGDSINDEEGVRLASAEPNMDREKEMLNTMIRYENRRQRK